MSVTFEPRRLVSTQSSWLHSYYYDTESSSLFVRFKDKQGRVTVTARYDDIPVEVWFGMVTASSKGEFLHSSGIFQWPYTLV